jgi:hypothetical protein
MAELSDEESDVELNTNDEQANSKQVQQKYVNKPRELFTKIKKPKLSKFKAHNEQEEEEEEEESEDERESESSGEDKEEEEYLDDEEYYKRLMAKSQEPDQEEEDDFQRQLRLEREEQQRKQSEENKEEKKTRRDPDGTEYEWDPVVKGWFPKLPDQKYIEYQQQSYILTSNTSSSATPQTQYAKPLENVNYFFNGAFYTWDSKENKWQSITTPVYEYVDYMTGYKFEWSQEKNEWQNKGLVYDVSQQQQQQQQSKSTVAPLAVVGKDPTKKAWFDINDDKNTNVYVSGLPFDITDEEFEQLMSKYGIIMKDPITHKLKVKLYRDENNEVKGDGRCCYLMVVYLTALI